MRIEHKLQIDAVKGDRIYYAEHGEYTFISDGKIGVYLKDKELKIDKEKMIKIHNSIFDPQKLKEARTQAKTTNTAFKILTGFAIKLKSIEEDNSFCFVDNKYLKMFPGYTGLFIESTKAPVLVLKFGLPYGIILPVNIGAELE